MNCRFAKTSCKLQDQIANLQKLPASWKLVRCIPPFARSTKKEGPPVLFRRSLITFINNEKKSIFEINSLHAGRYAGKNLIRDGFQNIRKIAHRQVITEYFHPVTLLTVDIRHINHANIHADITHVRSLLPVHQTIAVTVAQVAIQSVGIADWNSGNS